MSINPNCSPEWISVSRVNSNISHRVSKERVRENIKIAARIGLVDILEVL